MIFLFFAGGIGVWFLLSDFLTVLVIMFTSLGIYFMYLFVAIRRITVHIPKQTLDWDLQGNWSSEKDRKVLKRNEIFKTDRRGMSVWSSSVPSRRRRTLSQVKSWHSGGMSDHTGQYRTINSSPKPTLKPWSQSHLLSGGNSTYPCNAMHRWRH